MPEAINPLPGEGDQTTELILELSTTMTGGAGAPHPEAPVPRVGHSLAGMVQAIEGGYPVPPCPRPLSGRRRDPDTPVAPGIERYTTAIAAADTNPMLGILDGLLNRVTPGSAPYDSISRHEMVKEAISSILYRYDLAPSQDEGPEASVSFKLGDSIVRMQHIGGGIKVTSWDGRLASEVRDRVESAHNTMLRQGLSLAQLHQYTRTGVPLHAAMLQPYIEADADKIDASFVQHVRQLRFFDAAAGFRQMRVFGDLRHAVPVAIHILARPWGETDAITAPYSPGHGTVITTAPGRFAAIQDHTVAWTIAGDGSLQRASHAR
jgi:hypothetical protein